MGQEIVCTARHDGAASEGRAQLETDEVRFRGEFRVVVPFAHVRGAHADGGTLVLEYPGGPLELELGDRAARWAHAILHPKSVVEKLGVKPGQRVALEHLPDPTFARQVEERGAELVDGGGDLDQLFVGVESDGDLAGVAALRARLARDGGLWLVRPKGKNGLAESAVFAAGRGAGLTDVKVVRFSATHTAYRFVIPVAEREEVAPE